MIAIVTGEVLEQNEKELILDVSGIGYCIFTPPYKFTNGEKVTLYTQLVIKDDAHELYGFQSQEEKRLFKILIGVSGVGPRTALQMLTLYTLPDLVNIIKIGDSKAIALVPGIGKKTAEKVVIDLKDKVEGFAVSENKASSDLVEALLSLGYKDFQIRPIVGDIDAGLPIQKQITEALKLIQK
ncbi:Holliday junction branch migration protein RuvA [Candidatus Nomurabacteria bacterium]|nr:Holliday junction branch migration protein RuvA [Candidatus Nomurabacteria bacterium]